MKRIAFILLCLLSCAQTLMAQGDRFRLSGRVIEQGSGDPIYMASILEKETGLWVSTDADGKFVLEGVKAGAHTFIVSVLGYEERVLKYPAVKSDINGIEVVMKVSSLSLDEVVVTAKEGGEMTTASKISKQTIEHIQPSSLTDVMQLLPGSVTANPSLTDVSSLSIRDIGTNTANAAGTALIVDGASLSNDANMQVMSAGEGANQGTDNVSATAGSGVDARQVSTDNIESIEVIRGIPSVVYGDLTSGAVVVKTKAGVTPWEARLKMDPKLKQVFLGKGLSLGNKAGVINFDADYALAFSDVRTKSNAYNRANFQLGYSNNFNKKLTFNVKLHGNYSRASNESDPDLLKDELALARDMSLKLNVNGKWIINKPWITNVDYLVAGGVTSQLSRTRKYNGSAGYVPATGSMVSGEALAFFTDPQYYSDVTIDGLPVDAQARLVANQFGKYGKVTNKVLLGFEWKMQGNSGIGKTFTLDCPPSPGSASAYRERSYSDIPYLHRFTGFIEDNIKFPIATTSFELQAGVRVNGIVANGVNTENFIGYEPRFNARYNIIQKRTGFRSLAIRGGWGQSLKMPSMIYLYPEDTYSDKVSFAYNDFSANNYGIAVVTTQRQSSANADLKLQQSRNIEAGVEFDAGFLSGSVVYFNEKMTNGYGFATEYVPIEYRRYGYTFDGIKANPKEIGSGAYPVYSDGKLVSGGNIVPSFVDTTFMAIHRPVNNIRNDKWGIEVTLDIAQIKPIRTSINISGAYMNIKSNETGLTHKLYSGDLNNRTFPYVGIYEGSSTMSNGSIRERLSTNIRFVTHIPEIAMVVTLTAQLVFMDRTTYLSELDGGFQPYFYDENDNRVSGQAALDDDTHTKFVNPVAIMGYDGLVIPFTQAMERDPQYKNLILSSNTAGYYLRQSYPFYGMLNLRLSKDIKKIATVSFYANNFLNMRGRVTNSVTLYPSDRNTPIYFGAEVKFKFK